MKDSHGKKRNQKGLKIKSAQHIKNCAPKILRHVTNSCELKLIIKRNHLVIKASSISHKINKKKSCALQLPA